MPESLKTIGTSAFYGCKSLKSVTIPSSVINIEMGAFDQCESLSEIIFKPESKLSEIGQDAFSACANNITITNLPENLKSKFINEFNNLTRKKITFK